LGEGVEEKKFESNCQNQGRDGVIERRYKNREEESRVDR
jgi:hypothetical protein